MFRRLRLKAGLEGLRFHDLRHTHVTHLFQRGVNPLVNSQLVGHADPGFTMRVYGHVLPGAQEDAAQKINAAFGGGG
jgi:integrase